MINDLARRSERGLRIVRTPGTVGVKRAEETVPRAVQSDDAARLSRMSCAWPESGKRQTGA